MIRKKLRKSRKVTHEHKNTHTHTHGKCHVATETADFSMK